MKKDFYKHNCIFNSLAAAALALALSFSFISCDMFSADDASGKVAFSLDERTVQNIRQKASANLSATECAGGISRSVSYGGVNGDDNLFMEISLRGGWQESAVIPVSNGSMATFESVPTGVSVSVKAVVFKQTASGRNNILYGKSNTFTVQAGMNKVTLYLGTEDPDAAGLPSNVLPSNLIFVANAAAGGDSANDGTEEHPLDSIQSAVAKIHELVQDPNNFYNSGEEWGIVLLSDLEGAQKVTTDADSDVFKLYIASKSAANIKTINGGFTSAPVNPSDNQTALTIESQIRYMVIQCVKITGGYAGQGGGLVHRGYNLDLMPGVEIYGNKAVAKGAGVYVQASSNYAAYLNIKGAVIRDNVCASANGSGGGVYILGSQEGVSKRSLFTLESGSITGNKADYGAGICAEGDCYVTIEDGSITSNSNYTTGTGAGGGIYLSNPTGSYIPKFQIKNGSITSNTSQEVGGIYARDAQLTFSGGTISGNAASSGTGQGLYAYNSNASSISLMSWSGNVSFGANDVVYLSNTAINVGAALTCAFIATIEPATYATDTIILVDGVKPAGYDLTSLYGRFAIKRESDGTEWHLESKPYTLSNGTITTSGVLKQGAASGSGGGGTSGNVVNLYVNSLSGYGSDLNNGLSEDSALMTLGAAFDKMTDSTKDYVVNVMSKVRQDGLTSDYSQLEISSGVRANSIKITGTNTDSDERVITGQYDYEGTGTVMKVTSSVPVTIESITITGGCSDSDHKGGCIEIGSGATVILGNDTYIQGGMVNGGFGGGVYVSADSTFIMKGNSVVQADQYSAVYLEEGAKIMIGSNLTGRTSDSIPYVAQITPASYSSTTAKIGIVSGSGTSLAAEHDKFAVTPVFDVDTGNPTATYVLDENGIINAEGSGGGTSGSVTLYVKDGGSSSAEGTESDPFGSISAAVATFSGSSGDANTDYVIKVIGEINDSVPSETCNIKSLTIEGATGSGSDSITGMSHIYYDSSPLIFKNIKITGSTSGIEIGTCWDPPSNYYHVNVTFDEGTLITGNTTSNANYGGAMYIYKDSTVTIKEGCEISGNYNTDSTNAGIVVSNGGSLVMEGGTLENNCRPPYGIGYAVYAMSGSTFEMKGGTIKNNGIGVKIANGSTFKMSGSACVAYNNNVGSDYSEDMIELESGAKIILDGDLQTTGTVPAGVIRPETYGETVQVLDQTTSGLIANNCGKFNVDPDTSSGFPGVKYKVGENGYLQEYAISLYVKEGGTGDGSSATSALASIEAAATYISQYGDSSKEFKIKIVETLTGAQILQGVDNTNAASITIEGANGLSNGVPQDCLDGQDSAQKTLTIKTDSDQLPVYIKNLKITGATQNGLYIGGTSFGGVSNVSTAVIIDEGALITGNGSSDPENTTDGGGVYVFRSSELYVYSGEISNNTATRYGGGIYSYGSVTLYGGTIKNNTATQGKGIYLESGYGTLEMGYHAFVDSSNDIYLPAGRVITISSSLTAPINPVAWIRVPDSEYQEDTNLQILDESTSGLINSYYQYFGVICPEGSGYSGSGYGYTINSSGELDYYNYN